MPKLIPAILTDDVADFRRKLDVAEKLSDEVHIDFMDGVFVETISVPAQTLVKAKTPADLEAHLMVKHPESFVGPLQDSQAKRLIIHVEAVDNVEFMIRLIKDHGFGIGLAINPETPLDPLAEHLSEIDLVHFLSVKPGRQGNPFQRPVLEKVRSLSDLWSSGTISIDGGIGEETIEEVAAAGANRIVVGSSLWKSDDPRETFNRLKQKL